VAAEADVALRAVVTSGTGTAASLYNRPVAGKTGTTNNNVDAWFNGFTPQLETTVWMGNLQGEVPIIIRGSRVYGADYPAHTWHDYSAAVLADQPVLPLPQVTYSLMPPTKYITSRALVHDDVLDHNYGYYCYGGYGGYSSYGCASTIPTTISPPVPAPGQGNGQGNGPAGGPATTVPPPGTHKGRKG
jgi:membrane peptidoglycan carboxypeptidase